MLKKKELIILVCILFISVLCIVLVKLYNANSNLASVQIIVNGGEILYNIPVTEDKQLHIETEYGYNDIVISEGKVYVDKADCPDLICVHQGEISGVGESIICLPHRLTIQIVGISDNYD